MWISKNIKWDGSNPDDWSLEYKVKLFIDNVDGWYLEIADKVINGWIEEDTKNTNSSMTVLYPKPVLSNYVPHSGWAVLKIAISYFELIRAYQRGEDSTKKSREFFTEGFHDVFPEFINTPVSKIMWKDLRNSFYHTGFSNTNILLNGTYSEAIIYDKDINLVGINPHKFIPRLRLHLKAYTDKLIIERNETLIQNFESFFINIKS